MNSSQNLRKTNGTKSKQAESHGFETDSDAEFRVSTERSINKGGSTERRHMCNYVSPPVANKHVSRNLQETSEVQSI